MITARPQKNLNQAKTYFREHLAHGDYYSEGQTVRGVWFGKGGKRLGLEEGKEVTEEAFFRLCDNEHPVTGLQLTVRKRIVDRRISHDFVVSPPKSVSILALVIGDGRIIEAHAASSLIALRQMEQVAATRVRKGGQVKEHVTGEIVAAVFQHDASRSLDPQLHTHFVVFNATWDPIEERWKALETRRMFDSNHFFTEVYRSELARRLQDLGYRLRTTENGFEIEGVSEEIIHRFSKGREAIVAEANRIEEELGRALSNNNRATIARAIRQQKIGDLSPGEVKASQRAQLLDGELAALTRLTARESSPRIAPLSGAAKEAIDFARDHLFERKSVVKRRELLKVALAYSRGKTILSELEAELEKRPEFLVSGDSLGTRLGLQEEKRMIALVNGGIGRCRPLCPRVRSHPSLNDEQRLALSTLLNSSDRVAALRGAAGTGKTEVLSELVKSIAKRHELVLLAPTKNSVQALQNAGLTSAQTVQSFFVNETLKKSLRNPVIVLDEAGLLSNGQLLALIEFTHATRGRLLLAGDTRQHTSVEAGDALRILERHSALRTVSLRQIQRQVDPEYRAAITDLSEGRGALAISRLERLGAISVLEGNERCEQVANDFVSSIKTGRSALVVCPTWSEVDKVNLAIRMRLQRLGKIKLKEKFVCAHRSLKWTHAQKRDFESYRPGLVLIFHKSVAKFQAGQSAEVLSVNRDALTVRRGRRRTAKITTKQLGCFEVAQPLPLAVAQDDRLLIQGNRKAAGLLNGQIVTVKRVKRNGSIRLTNGKTIPPDFRLFTYGHALTSQSAQGRTVDHVYVLMDKDSYAANEKALYVSASRGRERVKLFCDSKNTLMRALMRPATRLSATELLQAARQQPNVRELRQASVKVSI